MWTAQLANGKGDDMNKQSNVGNWPRIRRDMVRDVLKWDDERPLRETLQTAANPRRSPGKQNDMEVGDGNVLVFRVSSSEKTIPWKTCILVV
jgi:hypothetical protein